MNEDEAFADTYDHVLDVEGRRASAATCERCGAELVAEFAGTPVAWPDGSALQCPSVESGACALRAEANALRANLREEIGRRAHAAAIFDAESAEHAVSRRALVALRAEVLRVANAMDASARVTGQYPLTRWTAQLREAAGNESGADTGESILADLQAPPPHRCRACGRRTSQAVGTTCGMTQPTGERCQGLIAGFVTVLVALVDDDATRDEAPYVCPGCHAVGERCALDCIDREIEEEREHAIESGDYSASESDDDHDDEDGCASTSLLAGEAQDDDATRDAARWAREDAGEVPDWDAEERAVMRQDREDRDNWNRRAS